MLNVTQSQATLVKHFSTFTLCAEEGSRISKVSSATSDDLAKILADFKPDACLADRLALALLTGREKGDCLENWRGFEDQGDGGEDEGKPSQVFQEPVGSSEEKYLRLLTSR